MKQKKNKKLTMERLTNGYEQFMRGKNVNNNGKKIFEKTIKRAIKPRGSK